MESDPQQRIEELFEQAIGLPLEQRDEFLRQQTVGVEMAARVRNLLRHHDLAGDAFLRGGENDGAPSRPLQRVGPYTILGVLGEGGMGTVYEAEQDHPRRRVALKLIRPGLMTAAMLRRFEYEAEVLGRLEHPGIARIYHAGVTETPLGRQPFFAMELVRGIPLDQWARETNPPLRKRLELLIAICQAVHHAHTRGVIHRDVKPANILIAQDGQPKVLDFGVARATDRDIQSTMVHTEAGQLVGTLPYMAPEQAAGRVHELDTSSDVYALGVIAYELLSGKMPYALEGKALPEQVRVICEAEPSRLSSIDRSLRGDVETIIAKALEKDRARRYPTAGELAADVKRHLDYEPITARSPSTWYQLRKFAGRNRVLVASAATVTLLLSAGVITSTGFAIRANRSAVTSARLSQSLRDMLASADPNTGNGNDYTVRQMLDSFSEKLGNQLADQPEAEAELQTTIGLAYRRLDDNTKALQHLGRALELRRSVFGDRHEKYADSLIDYSEGLHEKSRHGEAEEHVRKALSIYHQRGVDTSKMIHALRHLEWHLAGEGKRREVEAVFQQAGAMVGGSPPESYPDFVAMYGWVVQARFNAHHYAEAELLARESIRLELKIRGRNHPETGWAYDFLAQALEQQQRLPEAVDAYEQALTIFRAVYPPDHGHIGITLGSVVELLQAIGDDSGLSARFPTPQDLDKVEALCRGPAVYKPFEGNPNPVLTQVEARARVATLYIDLANEYATNGKAQFTQTVRARATALVDELLRETSPDEALHCEALLALVDPLLRLNRVREAEACAIKALELNPWDGHLLNDTARRLAAQTNADARDPRLAVSLAEKAVQIRPGRDGYWNTLGIARYRAGDYPRSIEALMKSADLKNGGGAADFFFLAMAHQQLRNSGAARESYDKGVQALQQEPQTAELLRFRNEATRTLGLSPSPHP